jgi:HEAT repeat protein
MFVKALIAGIYLSLCLASLEAQTVDAAPEKRARDVLEAGSSNPDPATRREVAVALSLAPKGDPATKVLTELARDKDALVREAAVVSIGELKDTSLAGAARKALDDDVPEVAFAAARTLFSLKQPEGEQLLTEVVEKEAKAKSDFIRVKIRDVMRRMKRPRSAILFVTQQGVGFIPVPGVGIGFSALHSLVTDTESSARATALLVLSADRSAETRRLVEHAFYDNDWSMRAAAVQIAVVWNERAWRSRLIPLFELEDNPRVRYRAAASYLRLGQSGDRAAK